MGMTIKDIAKKCGVGVSTVSRARNNHPDINPETKKMILKTVEESDFVPNNSARNLKRTDSKSIAILVKEIDNPFFATMMRVMEKEIRRQKYSFFIQHMGKDQDEVDTALELIKEKKLRGIIFLGGDFRKNKERIAKIKVPFVVSTAAFDKLPEKCIASYVSINDCEESRKIVDHLCETGHKKIAILASDEKDENIGKLRLEGYREALEAHGLEADEERICYLDEEDTTYSMENGYRMMKKLLKNGTEFTAVFAISDLMVIGACKALLEEGKRIPEDVAVAGFDGLDYTGFYQPAITTMAQPVEEIARESVGILFDMIETKKSQEGVYLPATLKERESTTGGRRTWKQD